MRHYHAKELEFPKPGMTDLFIFSASNLPATAGGAPVNDFSVGFNAQSLLCTALAIGDVILGAVIDVKTAIVGPTGTPTVQVKTGTGAVAITPTLSAVATGTAVTDNTVVGCTASTVAENLNLVTAAGGGNSAAATAGEIWVWVNIFRAERLQTQA